MTNTWILTTDERIAHLVDTAAAIEGTTTVLVVAPSAPAMGGVDRVVHLPVAEDVPAEALAVAVADLVAGAEVDLVLVPNRPAERSFAGAVAARLALPVLVGATTVAAGSAQVARYGGLSIESVSYPRAVLVLEGGAAAGSGDAPVDTHEATPAAARITSVQPATSGPANLAAARRIVACGRGFKAEEDLALARALADAVSGEIACSRPLAEGTAWLSKDRYIGVSGIHVSPEVYFALGISGQVQHTSGMSGSKVVVAVNTDANAPIFQMADYGIVGDLYEVVPAITAALS
ncbi:electron transfer flavoprotein subunit alpha/FixB family protein [Schaalia sp. 19OD2882]|uniref:electron transfer flavoprotein subunit alpha/FixB family protein n=1 Tax=Schaalia sp. 19OD2882 TaxID=2794089 RepID=UPI001C1F0834|nr:electron transfer flavoprotein subunit alpha/FixB family protein [Schaalia sp. 19OD2882]QWW18969.1 electron transfer flavoprotein subunit alpha/FixB family protein [Schaalia sp. 19OD2882]